MRMAMQIQTLSTRPQRSARQPLGSGAVSSRNACFFFPNTFKCIQHFLCIHGLFGCILLYFDHPHSNLLHSGHRIRRPFAVSTFEVHSADCIQLHFLHDAFNTVCIQLHSHLHFELSALRTDRIHECGRSVMRKICNVCECISMLMNAGWVNVICMCIMQMHYEVTVFIGILDCLHSSSDAFFCILSACYVRRIQPT